MRSPARRRREGPPHSHSRSRRHRRRPPTPADPALPGAGVPVVDTNTRGPAPGLNLGIGFWRGRLASLNRDQAEFEALEWKLTHSVMDAARDYLVAVVVPAVGRAEKGGA